MTEASVIRMGEYIYVFPGEGDAIQRIDLEGESIKKTEIIGTHGGIIMQPALLEASQDFCV